MDRRELGKQLFGRLNELRGSVVERGERVVEPRRAYRPEFRVLAYRRFWPPTPELRALFTAQLDYLHNHHVVRSLPEIMLDQRAGRLYPDGTIVITVDGGHRDFFQFAYPLLRARGLSATLFLPVGFLDGGWLWFDRIIYALRNTRATRFRLNLPDGDTVDRSIESPAEKRAASGSLIHALQRLPEEGAEQLLNELFAQLSVEQPATLPDEFAPLQWDEANEMWPNNISFGAQLVSHPDLLTTEAEEDIRRAMQVAKDRVAEKLGDYEILLSYPPGSYDERIVQMAKQLGYLGAVSNEPGPNNSDSDPFRIRRISVEPGMPVDQLARFCAVTPRP